MEGMDGNSEVLPNKEFAYSTKLITEATYVESATQPLVTCISPTLVNKPEQSPLVDLTNILNSPTCTSLPSKLSWTRFNCILFALEEKLEVPTGKKRSTPSRKIQ